MNRLRERRRSGDDGGFGLIETVVALLIAGIVFGALATTLISAVQASLFGRQNQQATDFMTRELEMMRTLDFGSIAMDSGDLGGDSRLSGCGITQCLGLEPVITATVSGVNPHTTVLTGDETNNTPFTVSRYVTMTDQPPDQAVRATVYVTWMNKGTVHTRSTSTIIAYTQRGLPLPVFKLELPIASQSVQPGGTLTYNLTLANQGAPDRWNLTLSGATSGWRLYADSDGDGILTSADALLTDTTLDGVDDTGRIDPSSTFRFFLTRDTTPAEALGDSTTTVTATSSGQPSATGATKSVVATSTVTTDPVLPPPGPTPTPTGPPVPPEVSCAAPVFAVFTGMHNTYTQRQYTLHNDGVGDTLLQPQMYFNAVWGDEPNLAHYSTDVDPPGLTGRVLAPAGATMLTGPDVLILTDPTRFADWSNTYNQKTDIDGTGILRLWVAPQGAGAGSMKVVLYMAATASASRTLITEVEVPLVLTCAGFQEVYLQLPDVPQPEVAKNGVLGVRVVTAGAENVRLAYDVPSQFPSSFTIGTRP